MSQIFFFFSNCKNYARKRSKILFQKNHGKKAEIEKKYTKKLGGVCLF